MQPEGTTHVPPSKPINASKQKYSLFSRLPSAVYCRGGQEHMMLCTRISPWVPCSSFPAPLLLQPNCWTRKHYAGSSICFAHASRCGATPGSPRKLLTKLAPASSTYHTTPSQGSMSIQKRSFWLLVRRISELHCAGTAHKFKTTVSSSGYERSQNFMYSTRSYLQFS